MVLKRICSHIYVMERRMQPQVGFSIEARRFVEKKRNVPESKVMQPQDVGFDLRKERAAESGEKGLWTLRECYATLPSRVNRKFFNKKWA